MRGIMSHDAPPIRHVIGCMTGTSLDGLDVALARITGRGLAMAADFVAMHSAQLPADLREALMSMASGEARPPLDYLRAARHLGVVHAEACAALIAQHPDLDIDFIVAHGQTIWHAPADRLSWQLFDPWPIVRALRLPVCYDLRQADLVADGEGAPITPIADWVMYRGKTQLIVNLGGICNMTVLRTESSKVAARDFGVCNILLDGLCRRFYGEPFDRDGARAMRGTVNNKLADRLMMMIDKACDNKRSLGRETGHAGCRAAAPPPGVDRAGKDDALRSASWAIALLVRSTALSTQRRRIVVAGGGCRNRALMQEIGRKDIPPVFQVEMTISDKLGIPCEAREAMGFAVLGALSQDGVPITLTRATGSQEPGIAGAWVYPARA